MHVLTALLKEQAADASFDVLRKHVADNLVRTLGTIEWNGDPAHMISWDVLPPRRGAPDSMLARFDMQKTRLANVFWRGANLRRVDFYGADLKAASLRNADLRRAVLYEADLTGVVLRDAWLDDANLESAKLRYRLPRSADARRWFEGRAVRPADTVA